MSRAAASKTRGADKTKPPTAAHTPVIAHEIVPGKFSDQDWSLMLDRDGGEDYVFEIMDELVDRTMSTIYVNYIEKQLLPFTITQARDAIVEIIEWQFLACDKGESHIDTDLGWGQDEEPEPAETDCWAQGSVPKNVLHSPTPELPEIPEEPEEIALEVDKPIESTDENEPLQQHQEPPELDDVVSETAETPDVGQAQKAQAEKKGDTTSPKAEAITQAPSAPRVSESSSKSKFRPYRGKLKSAGVSKMTESLEEREMQMIYNEIVSNLPPQEDKPNTLMNMPASCTSILKVQTGRPPGNKDVAYDDLGNVVAVMKLDPEKLPTHKVSVKYHVVDPAVEAAQARLDAMRKGKSTGKVRKIKSTNLKSQVVENVPTTGGASKSKSSHSSTNVTALPPSLNSTKKSRNEHSAKKRNHQHIEEMEVANGVIIREGGRVKKGPGRYYGKLDILEEHQKGMKPVSMRLNNGTITVNDILDRNTPIMRPIADTAPLPPILPHPPSYPQASTVS